MWSWPEYGIIYIDEIDKITRKSGKSRPSPATCRGEGVQQALLKMLGGHGQPTYRPQGGRKHPQQEFIQIDTTNILFICGGAFDGIDGYHPEAAPVSQGTGLRF